MKHTKKALLMSALSLLLCLSMLVGTTFAWFTDTASTNINKIQAGTLDVVLEVSYDNGNTWTDAEGKTLDFIKAEGAEDEEILWEPGCTYELPLLRVRNEGNLWLKYQLAITGIKGDARLNEAIEWSNGTDELNLETLNAWTNLAPKGTSEDGTTDTSDFIKIVGHMKEEAGNEYQGLSIEGVSITVFATQVEHEYDSTDNTYDKDAPALVMIGETKYDSLEAAVAAAESGDTIALAGIFTLPTDGSLKNRTLTFEAIDESISVIDMKNVATGQSTSSASLTFKGVDVVFDNTANYKGIQHAAKVVYEDCTLYGKQFLYAPADFTRCEFVNYVDYAVWTYGSTAANFTDCTFTTGGKAVLVYGDSGTITAKHTFTNCTFHDNDTLTEDDGSNLKKAAVEVGAGANATYTIEFTNCTTNGFAANKSNSPLWGNKNSMDADHLKVTVDGETSYWTANQTALNDVIANAGTDEAVEVILPAGNYTLLGENDNSPNLTNKTVTFSGTKDTVMDLTGIVGATWHTQDTGATLIFDGVTVKWGEDNEGYQGFSNAEKVVYKNCTIYGTQFMGGDAEFINCVFEAANTAEKGYAVYGRGAGTLTFTDCTFNTDGRAIMLFQDQTTEVNVVMTNCTFKDNGNYNSKNKAVVETGDGQYKTSKFNITITNCTCEGFEANNSTSPLWGNKDSIPADRLNVTIDGEDVY